MAKRILVIDDDETIVETLKVLLGIKGYEVETASDGNKGLSMARSSAPDLILLDIFLPGMDGAEVFRELQKTESCAHVPVLFLSSFSERPDILDDERILPGMFIPKPVDPMKLLNSIEDAFAGG